MNEDELALLGAMQRYGGSFASALAEAWMRADASNRVKLQREFGPLLESYRRFLPQPAVP
jgi:hypothetical protein